MKTIKIIFSYFFFKLICISSFSQISQGGLPKSFEYVNPNDFETIILKKPNVDSLLIEDEKNDAKGYAYRYGVNVPVNVNLDNSGTWTDLPDNAGKIWRLKIICPDAKAITIYYDDYFLPPDCKLFVYNENKTQILGAYTDANNHESRLFANELVYGETVILEYFQPYSITKPNARINLSKICYAYRGVPYSYDKSGFGSSGSCEVNINCSEGSQWQNEKRGVARIGIIIGSNGYWCTGSLINNTNNNCTPYFLTADHCTYSSSSSSYATAQDLNQWIFYFNYESSICSNPATQPSSNTLTGCSYVSWGLMNGGSDFDLLQLNTTPIPSSYNVFFNGWNKTGTSSPNGAGIHHPAGDIKKISTYSTTLTTGTYNSDFTCATNAHWVVHWVQTTNGWGVTEGGSSGSPLFDNYGRIIGTLTGGSSYCTSPSNSDYYGKFSFHWQSNGTNNNNKLQPWLDPANTSNYFDGRNNCNIGSLNCTSAANLICGSTYTSNTAGNSALINIYGCIGWNETGPEKVHKITSTSTGTITASISGMTADLDIFILNSCDPNSCVAYGDNSATYSNAPAGIYYIVVDGYNGASGSYTLTYSYPGQVTGAPVASFTNSPTQIYQGQNVHFLDQSSNSPTAWLWNFGDGSTSSIKNPYHTFTNAGGHNVSLKAYNSCGNNTYTKYINVLSTAGFEDIVFKENIQIFPNPATNVFEIKYESSFDDGAFCQIIDLTGKIIQQSELAGQSAKINIAELSRGIYSVKIFNGDKVCVKKLSKL